MNLFENLSRPLTIREAMQLAAIGQGAQQPVEDVAVEETQTVPKRKGKPFYEVPEERTGMFGQFLDAITDPFTGNDRKRTFNQNLDAAREVGQRKRALALQDEDRKFQRELAMKLALQRDTTPDPWTGFSPGEGAPFGAINKQTGEFKEFGRTPMKPRSNDGDGTGRPLTPTAALSAFRQWATRDIPPDDFDYTTNRPKYSAQQADKARKASTLAYQYYRQDPNRDAASAWERAYSEVGIDAPDPFVGNLTKPVIPQPGDATPAPDATGQPNFVMRPQGEQPKSQP
jgi:hypothetical protein